MNQKQSDFVIISLIFYILMLFSIGMFNNIIEIIILINLSLYFGFVAFYVAMVNIGLRNEHKAKIRGMKRMWYLVNQNYNLYKKRFER